MPECISGPSLSCFTCLRVCWMLICVCVYACVCCLDVYRHSKGHIYFIFFPHTSKSCGNMICRVVSVVSDLSGIDYLSPSTVHCLDFCLYMFTDCSFLLLIFVFDFFSPSAEDPKPKAEWNQCRLRLVLNVWLTLWLSRLHCDCRLHLLEVMLWSHLFSQKDDGLLITAEFSADFTLLSGFYFYLMMKKVE